MSEASSRDKWRRFKRAEAAMWHATMLYRGTASKPADVIKAAKLFQQHFDEVYSTASPIGDAETRRDSQKTEHREPIPNPQRHASR